MKRKEKIILWGSAVLLLGVIVGISYAAFTFGQSGKNLNTITTGIMQMSYEESSNVIKMTGALPTTDATGKVRLNEGEYFDFTVSSTIQGDAQINWEIAAEDFSSNTFDGKNVKLYLTSLDSSGNETEVMAPKVFTKKTTENKKTGRPANTMSLATGTMSASTSTKYRLRMYVDEKYNPQGDGGGKKFAIRINVYGKVYEEPTGSQMKTYTFGQYSDMVTKVETKNTNEVPSTAIASFDISEAGDGSVMTYMEADGTAVIAGKGGIIAPVSLVSMFANLNKVTSIDLTYMDTSKVTNMTNMFYNCSSLTNLDVSNFDTSKVTNMNSMFYQCNLTSLDLSSFNTLGVTNMSDMFYKCSSLTSLDLSSFNTSGVTNMSDMFCYCSSLTSIDVSNFDTSNVTDMTGMFDSCSNLTSIDLTSFDTSKVTNMIGMFKSCSSLTNLDLSNFDTSNVTNMYEMFCLCSNLTSIDVSNFNTSKVTNMYGMFYNCSSLTSLNLSNFDTSNVTGMASMFGSCSNLTSIDLTSFDTSKVASMSGMFENCTKMQSIKVSSKWVIGSDCNKRDMYNGCGVSAVTYV